MFRVRVAGDFPFLSTPSARRATERPGVVELARAISIHALREEGDLLVLCKVHHQGDFYPRPPRGGRPLSSSVSLCRASNFYPRPPRGGRRTRRPRSNPQCGISIHALREEGDAFGYQEAWSEYNFYPRPPRGGRPRVKHARTRNLDISIHALREEGDPGHGG